MPRNYAEEYARESSARKKMRAVRNNARRRAIREGDASVGDGTVVHHKKPLKSGGSNSKSNTTVQSRKASNSEGGRRQPKSGKRKGGRS